MSDDDCGCGEEHERHPERIWLKLTPGGVQVNVLGVFHDLWESCQQERWSDVAELVDLMGVLLTAAYRGDFVWIDDNYQEAIVSGFRKTLETVDDVAAAFTSEGGETD